MCAKSVSSLYFFISTTSKRLSVKIFVNVSSDNRLYKPGINKSSSIKAVSKIIVFIFEWEEIFETRSKTLLI